MGTGEVRRVIGSAWAGDNRDGVAALPLDGDCAAEVCVIGAGVAGLSVAYELALRGADVVVLEAARVARGETSRSTAHLVTALDERYFAIAAAHGRRAARLAARSHRAAIDRIAEIVRTESISCEFEQVDGVLIVPRERAAESRSLLERELSACLAAGVAVDVLPRAPQMARDTGACLRFPGQGQLNPVRYVEGLAKAVREHGGRVFTGTRVVSVDHGQTETITTADGAVVRAGSLVVATHEPLVAASLPVFRQTLMRSYVVGLARDRPAAAGGLLWDGHWDDGTPYHYVRTAASAPGGEEDLLLVGGEDHVAGLFKGRNSNGGEQHRYDRLEEWARRHFSGLGPVVRRWFGDILEPSGELALIGRIESVSGRVFVVTGDSGNGMTYAAIAGLMLPDLIAGHSHAWEELYSPSRALADHRSHGSHGDGPTATGLLRSAG